MTPSEWSKAVIARDKVCAGCGVSEPLHAHHIKPKSLHPELKFDLGNGEAVCPTCHWKRHHGSGAPRVQAKKRRPHFKTMEKQVEYYKKRAVYGGERQLLAGELIADLEREVAKLREENKLLLRRLNYKEKV